MEKRVEQGLAIAGPAGPELLCHTCPSAAPGSSTVRQRTAIPGSRRSRSQPLISSSPGGEAFFNARIPPQNPQDYEIMPDKRRCSLAPS